MPSIDWKFSSSDLKERGYWDKYQHAYEEIFKHTSTDYAPWYILPADNKWFTRTAACDIINDQLQKMNLRFPEVGDEMKKEIDRAKEVLSK
jgi:polyphosphate kinase 2 (PPK2 family)